MVFHKPAKLPMSNSQSSWPLMDMHQFLLHLDFGDTQHVTLPSPLWLMTLVSKQYTNRADAEHLMQTLNKRYKVSEDWEGTRYCGLTVAWDYNTRTCDISMPSYIELALQRFFAACFAESVHFLAVLGMVEPTLTQSSLATDIVPRNVAVARGI
jgi:hypothetical protein